VPRSKKNFSPEYRGEAVKMVIETSRPVAQVARELGMNEGTLSNWVNAYRRAHPVEDQPLTVSERIRLRELEKEVRELRMKTEFLGKAAAFFAQEYR
jgi:transposase